MYSFCVQLHYKCLLKVILRLKFDPKSKGVAGGMNVVEGLFSCPPVHYVLDWSRLVSTLVQEDKEE